MDFSQYQLLQVNQFNGLWDRGSVDDVPQDHAIACVNMAFNERKEYTTRIGTVTSENTAATVTRMKMATMDNFGALIYSDGQNGIWRADTNQQIIYAGGCVSFELINIAGKVIIAPVYSSFTPTNYIFIWDDPSKNPRFLGGAAPVSGIAPIESTNAGVINAGVHNFAVAYGRSKTGWVSPPNPINTSTSYTASGNLQVDLYDIPTSPDPTVDQRIILVTPANMTEMFFLPNGIINDNTTGTLLGVNFADTALTVSADYLYDQAEYVLSGVGSVGLCEYAGRLFVFNGGGYVNNVGGSVGITADTVMVSNTSTKGGVEAFDMVAGQLNVPSQHDGNMARGGCPLFGVLYIIKAVGIFSTTDNGNDPSSWTVMMVDGSVGCYPAAMASITASQNNLGIMSQVLLGDQEGLFAFNGNVLRPELSYKIANTWRKCSDPSKIRIAVDPFQEIIYVLLPIYGTMTMFMGDYSLGLDAQSIRWSEWDFPWFGHHIDIGMFNIQDLNSYEYALRIALDDGGIYRLSNASVSGGVATDYGNAIDSYYQTSLMAPMLGALNVYRYLRFKIRGTGNLITILTDQSNFVQTTVPAIPITLVPQGYRDTAFQINWVGEKMSVRMQNTAGPITCSRMDLYAKPQNMSRPTV